MSTQPPLTSPPPSSSSSNTSSPTPPSPSGTNNTLSPPPPPTNSTGSPTSPPPPTNTTQPSPSPPAPNVTIPTSISPAPPSKGLPPGTLAGLIVGTGLGAIIVLVGVGICFFFYRRKKKREAERLSLGPAASGPKDDPSAGLPLRWQHYVPPRTDDKVTGLPRPTPPPGVSQQSPVDGSTFPEPYSTSNSFGEGNPNPSPSPGPLGLAQITFSYEELARATDNFANMNLLGQGGFGYVHKGILPNGKLVAIKQLKAGSGQGEREFRAEIEIISRVHHRHLVSLIGYCITGMQRMLVYEFVPNNNLEFHLHGKGRPAMNWSTRMKIAIGSAKGLAYLHEDCHPKIIHRDIKAANILLDDKFEAKVADFGLARYSLDTDTHVSTRVMGTFGYMAPEYASTGKLTEKSDIFSFGVVLLELITGRRPVDRSKSFLDESIVDDSLVDWARPLMTRALEDGNYDSLADPKLQKDYDSGEMTRMISCAAACVRYSARLRPRMSEIVRVLEGNMSLDSLSDGITPGHSVIFSSYGSTDYSSGQYKEDLKKFRKMALESQEQGSAEYSGATSEYGQHPSSSSTEGQQTTQEVELKRVEERIKDSENSKKLD